MLKTKGERDQNKFNAIGILNERAQYQSGITRKFISGTMLKWKMKILLHQDADTQLDEKILNWCTVCLYLHGSVHMHLCL